jgi:hypothetical protein
MNQQFRQCKRAIRQFLQTAYTDERLAWLLAHARSGKLAYRSCCCFVGVVTAPHALQAEVKIFESVHPHYLSAKALAGAPQAERAYCALGYIDNTAFSVSQDDLRRRRLIPMVRAEMGRREKDAAKWVSRTFVVRS